MILKLLQCCYWDSWILVYSWFNSSFMIITKWKLHFSLIRGFYCYLVKEGWALIVASQFAMQGLVACKPTPTPHRKPICQAIYLPPGQSDSHISINISKKSFQIWTFARVRLMSSQWLRNRGELRVKVSSDWSFRHYLRVVKG